MVEALTPMTYQQGYELYKTSFPNLSVEQRAHAIEKIVDDNNRDYRNQQQAQVLQQQVQTLAKGKDISKIVVPENILRYGSWQEKRAYYIDQLRTIGFNAQEAANIFDLEEKRTGGIGGNIVPTSTIPVPELPLTKRVMDVKTGKVIEVPIDTKTTTGKEYGVPTYAGQKTAGAVVFQKKTLQKPEPLPTYGDVFGVYLNQQAQTAVNKVAEIVQKESNNQMALLYKSKQILVDEKIGVLQNKYQGMVDAGKISVDEANKKLGLEAQALSNNINQNLQSLAAQVVVKAQEKIKIEQARIEKQYAGVEQPKGFVMPTKQFVPADVKAMQFEPAGTKTPDYLALGVQTIRSTARVSEEAIGFTGEIGGKIVGSSIAGYVRVGKMALGTYTPAEEERLQAGIEEAGQFGRPALQLGSYFALGGTPLLARSTIATLASETKEEAALNLAIGLGFGAGAKFLGTGSKVAKALLPLKAYPYYAAGEKIVSKVAIPAYTAWWLGSTAVELVSVSDQPELFKKITTKQSTAFGAFMLGTGLGKGVSEFVLEPAESKLARLTLAKTQPELSTKLEKGLAIAKQYGLKEIPISEPAFANVKKLKGNKILIEGTKTFLQENPDVVLGGSLSQTAQVPKAIKKTIKPNDFDLYSSNPKQTAEQLVKKYVAAGVERVSSTFNATKNSATITWNGKTIGEVHSKYETLYANISQVRGFLEFPSSVIKKTPSGISILGIKTQAQRKAVGGYVGNLFEIEKAATMARPKDVEALKQLEKNLPFYDTKKPIVLLGQAGTLFPTTKPKTDFYGAGLKMPSITNIIGRYGKIAKTDLFGAAAIKTAFFVSKEYPVKAATIPKITLAIGKYPIAKEPKISVAYKTTIVKPTIIPYKAKTKPSIIPYEPTIEKKPVVPYSTKTKLPIVPYETPIEKPPIVPYVTPRKPPVIPYHKPIITPRIVPYKIKTAYTPIIPYRVVTRKTQPPTWDWEKPKEIKRKKKKIGFDVFVKRKGKFAKINVLPLTERSAYAFGQKVTDITTARSFFALPSGRTEKPVELDLPGFRPERYYKSKRTGALVERSKYAISTGGEKIELREGRLKKLWGLK